MRQRLGWEPTPDRVHLFRVEIGEVTYISYDDATGDQFVARWPANREFVRRGDGGTALRDPTPHEELLDPPFDRGEKQCCRARQVALWHRSLTGWIHVARDVCSLCERETSVRSRR